MTGAALPVRLAFAAGLAGLAAAGMVGLATAAARGMLVVAQRRRRRAVARWQPALVRALADPHAPAPPVRRGERAAVLELWNHYQESLRGEARERLVAFARRAGLDRVALSLLRRGNTAERLMAVATLGHLREPAVVGILMRLAASRRPVVSLEAVRALVRIDPRAGTRFTASLLASRPEWHAARVAAILTEADPQTVAREVAEACLRAPAAARPRLIRVLESTRSPAAREAVRALLDEADDDEVVAACLRALSRFRDPRDAEAVRRYASHPSWFVRVQAAAALGRLGGPQDAATLLSMLSDPEWWVRYRAAQALAGLRTGGGPALLEEVRRTHPDPFARDIAAQVLAEAGA